ncbi:hypothetical protein [Actinomadura napierensis]|uniref:Uncharacterized protein n=1 Tax=Actinomadura napierensis TaxID=267854 RepID=A0ABP5LBG6_9ACTN
MTDGTDVHLPPGTIQLYDHFRPGLEAGTYQISVRQTVQGMDTGTYFVPHVQSFTVAGPRFALAPGDIGEQFPPADSNGVYGNVLPSIVLNHRTLPWERAVSGDPAVPWLALLTFQAGEVLPDPATSLPLRVSTVAEFLTSPDPGVLVPRIPAASIPADVLAGTMTSVVVPLAAFTAVAPSLPEAALLAHVRQIDTAHQAESAASSDGWYSVVVGNRLPGSTVAADGTGTRSLACLVSIEGLTEYLPGGAGRSQASSVRLAVLASWSFVSNPAATEDFAQLMGGLVAPGAALLPRVPVPASAPPSPATKRLAEGYVPLSYHTATGEDTFAWYRGPFSPVVPPPLPVRSHQIGHYAAASDVTIYLEDQGVFDLSYAVAFEAGRLAALSDRAFAVALVNGRRAAYRALGDVAGRLTWGRLARAEARPPQRPVGPRWAWRHFGALLKDGMGAELSAALGQAAETPAAPPVHPAAAMAPVVRTAADPVAATRGLLAHAEVQGVLADHVTDAMDPVTDWLARLALLHQVPFRHLVPDERMLPVESIRFFYLDENWIAALTDGALSIGVEGSRDLELHAAWGASITRTVAEKVGRVRADRRERPDLVVPTGPAVGLAATAAPPARAGFLLRSAAVSGWPGLVVQADGGATPLLRLDRLSDTVLLAIFDGVPGSVTFGEPWHGLRFGLAAGNLLHLRAPDGTALNTRFPAAGTGDVLSGYTRPVTGGIGRRVLTVAALAHALRGVLGDAAPMGSALLATQLFLTPQQLTFQGPTGRPGTQEESR